MVSDTYTFAPAPKPPAPRQPSSAMEAGVVQSKKPPKANHRVSKIQATDALVSILPNGVGLPSFCRKSPFTRL